MKSLLTTISSKAPSRNRVISRRMQKRVFRTRELSLSDFAAEAPRESDNASQGPTHLVISLFVCQWVMAGGNVPRFSYATRVDVHAQTRL